MTSLNWQTLPLFYQEIRASLPSPVESQQIVNFLVSRTEYHISVICSASVEEERTQAVNQLFSETVSISLAT